MATGGLPAVDVQEGEALCTTTWDVLTGQVALSGDVLVFDGTGRHPAPLAAERAVEMGARVAYISVDAFIAEELTYSERTRWKQLFLKYGIQPVTETRLIAVERQDNRLLVKLFSDLTQEVTTRIVDHVVVEQGSIPMSEVYDALRGRSANDGVTDLEALVKAEPQPSGPAAGFALHRIGDAVSSRNIHSAMLDALRICSGL